MDISNELYKIMFTNDAISEMKNIFDYIFGELYAPNVAKDLMLSIDKSIDNLKYMPKTHRVIKKYDELDLEYRRIVVKQYCIIYTIDETDKKVYIIHLYHSKRNYFNLF